MRRLLLLMGLCLAASTALAQMLQLIPNDVAHGGGGAYTGPGDIATFTVWYSTARAYSSAARGTNAVRLCQPAGSNCVNIASDATTGIVPNAPTVNGSACDNASHKCFIDTIYDQTATASNLTQVSATAPQWLPSATGSHPCGLFVAANSNRLETPSGPTTITQPFLVTGVAKRSGSTGNQNVVFNSDGGGLGSSVWLYHNTPANDISIYAGNANVSVTLTDGTFGSMAGIYNGASSSINVNSSTASGNAGTGVPNAAQNIGRYGSGNSGYYDGDICEAGWANGVSSTTTRDNLMSNAKTFYGF